MSSSSSLTTTTTTNQLLVEIVGATNIPPHAAASSTATNSPRAAVQGSVLNPLTTLGNVSSSLSNVSNSVLQDTLFSNRQASVSVKVLLNQEKIHKTKVVTKTNHPIWTVESGSLFLVDSCGVVGPKKMLTFEVRDRDPLMPGKTDCIGTVRVDVNTILERWCTEERVEFPIVSDVYQAAREGMLSWDDEGDGEDAEDDTKAETSSSLIASPGGEKSSKVKEKKFEDTPSSLSNLPILALRFRQATAEDVRFIENLGAGRLDLISQDSSSDEIVDNELANKKSRTKKPVRQKSLHLMTEDDVQVGGAVGGLINSAKFTFTASQGKGHKMKLRVKPGPDPTRPTQTRFLSEEELIAATYSSSKSWVECGSGSHGRVFLEVLHCDNLPNCDAGGGLAGNKTNAFVSIVHEDAAVQTGAIQSCLSPLWLPWTRRAFAFNRMHPLSSIYIGVFHFDAVSPLGHQGIGRVAINLQQIKPNHEYILKYHLYDSSVYSNRMPNGTITVRLRIDSSGCERTLLKAIHPLPQIQINAKKKKTHDIVTYTCYGQHVDDKFDIKLLKSQVNEMLELVQDVQYAVVDAAKSLVFWKGQVMLGNGKFPVYSLLAYVFCAHVVERPHLLPSLLFWCLFFIMIASYGHRCHHPSPWHRCRSISDYISIIVKGKDMLTVTRTKAGEGVTEVIALDQAWKRRIELDALAASKRAEMQQKASEVEEVADKKNGAGSRVPQIDPLSFLVPVQQKIEQSIYFPRAIKSVIIWESSTISFVITACSFAMAVMLSILPTAWLIQWTCRILVHCFLGPHMKLVDLIFNQNAGLEDDSDQLKQEQVIAKKLAKEFQGKNKLARIKTENETKLNAMRKIRIGRWSVKIPLNVTRYYDYPLPADSTAAPLISPSQKGWNGRIIVPGQKLYGCMIPQPLFRKQAQESTNMGPSSINEQNCMDGEGGEVLLSNNEDDANDAIPNDELQQLVECKLHLAEAKANIDASFCSQEEVERLNHLVEERSHISLGDLVDAEADGSRESILIVENSLDENSFEEKDGPDGENLIKDEKNCDASEGGSAGTQSGASDNEEMKEFDPFSSKKDGSEVGIRPLRSVDLQEDSDKTADSTEELVVDTEEVREQRDDDDDPFSTYDKEKRILSKSAMKDALAPPPDTVANPLRRLFRRGRAKSD